VTSGKCRRILTRPPTLYPRSLRISRLRILLKFVSRKAAKYVLAPPAKFRIRSVKGLVKG
jgi:hypothetical protein